MMQRENPSEKSNQDQRIDRLIQRMWMERPSILEGENKASVPLYIQHEAEIERKKTKAFEDFIQSISTDVSITKILENTDFPQSEQWKDLYLNKVIKEINEKKLIEVKKLNTLISELREAQFSDEVQFVAICAEIKVTLEKINDGLDNQQLLLPEEKNAIREKLRLIDDQITQYQTSILNLNVAEFVTGPSIEDIKKTKEYRSLFNFLKKEENQKIVSVLGGPATEIVEHHADAYVKAINILQQKQSDPTAEVIFDDVLKRQVAQASLYSDLLKYHRDGVEEYGNMPPVVRNQFQKAKDTFDKKPDGPLKDRKAFFLTLIDQFKHYRKSFSHKISKETEVSKLYVRAFAELQDNIRVWPDISSVHELLIAQQKRDAIIVLEKQMENLDIEDSSDQFIQAKYYAYLQLIAAIHKSPSFVPLSVLIAEGSSYLNQPVLRPLDPTLSPLEEHKSQTTQWIETTLPGRARATISEVLSYQRGVGRPTSEKTLKKLRIRANMLHADIDKTEGIYKTKILQQLLAENPDNTVLRSPLLPNKLYVIRASKHFNERRILEIDTTKIEEGKTTTQFYPDVTHVWKIGPDNQVIGHKNIKGRMGAKYVLDKKWIKSFEHEIKLAQENVPSAKMKDAIEGEGPQSRMAFMALMKGESLFSILVKQQAIQEKIDELTKTEARLNKDGKDSTEVRAFREALETQLLTKEQRIKICIDISRDLRERLHNTNIVYMDLKPENIIIDMSDPNDPKAKIIDFDLSHKVGDVPESVGGSLHYAHPESRFTQNAPLYADRDLFSLAFVLAEVLIGSRQEGVTFIQRIVSKLHLYPHFATMDEIVEYLLDPASMPKFPNIRTFIDEHFAELIHDSKVEEKVLDRSLLDEVVKPLLENYKTAEKSLKLEKCIEAFDAERLKLKAASGGPTIEVDANKAATEARDALQKMRLASEADKAHPIHSRTIQTIISKSLVDVTDNEQSLKEYLHTLGIKALKDLDVGQGKQEIEQRVEDIIQVYETYKNYPAIIPTIVRSREMPQEVKDQLNRIAHKMEVRYEKHQDLINKTLLTLDDMADLNKLNREDLLSIEGLDRSLLDEIHHRAQEIYARGPIGDEYDVEHRLIPDIEEDTSNQKIEVEMQELNVNVEAEPGPVLTKSKPKPKSELKKPEVPEQVDQPVPPVFQYDLRGIVQGLKEFAKTIRLPVLSKLDIKLDGDADANQNQLEDEFKKIAGGIAEARRKPNYKEKLLTNDFSGSKYKINLIYRAIDNLNNNFKDYPHIRTSPDKFNSLEELLNYQQKLDILTELRALYTTASKKRQINKYTAYSELYNTINKQLNDHSKSAYDIIGVNRKAFFHQYLFKKLDSLHFFKNSGDVYNQICNLPQPKVFLAQKHIPMPENTK